MEFSGLLVGAALASIIIVASATMFMTLRAQGVLGVEEYRLYCFFDKGLGLRVGTKVQVNGVEVGRVSNLGLTPMSKVKLTFTIKTDYKPWITSDARVYATRDQNVIAERIINIEQPSGLPLNPAKVLQDGQELYAGQAQDIETVVEKAIQVLDMVERIAINTDKLLAMALDTQSTLGAMIGSRHLYDQLNLQVNKLDNITTHTEEILTAVDRRLPPLLDRTDTLVGKVGMVGDKLGTLSDRAVDLVGSIDTTVYSMNLILGDLQTLTRSASDLLVDGEAKLERVDDLVTGVSKFWFIRNRMPKKDTIPILSEERW